MVVMGSDCDFAMFSTPRVMPSYLTQSLDDGGHKVDATSNGSQICPVSVPHIMGEGVREIFNCN